MTLASKKDITKRENKLKSLMKTLEDDGSVSDKDLINMVRGAIRAAWMKHPSKIAYILKKSYPDLNPNTRTKWLIDCEMCEETFKLDDIEVDHIIGEHQFLSIADIVSYTMKILGANHEELQILCKECHGIKTYAEREGVSLEYAAIEKQVLYYLNVKNYSVTEQKEILLEEGYSAEEITNREKRRKCFRELLTDEDN